MRKIIGIAVFLASSAAGLATASASALPVAPLIAKGAALGTIESVQYYGGYDEGERRREEWRRRRWAEERMRREEWRREHWRRERGWRRPDWDD
jgi:hypothetical protein